jgi:hypothetical protein
MRSFAWPGLAAFVAGSVFGQTVDIVDIHASPPNSILEMRRFVRGHYELKNATLVDLIRTAWGVDADKAILRQILTDRFHLGDPQRYKEFPAYAITAIRKPQLKPADESEAAGCKIEPAGEPVQYVRRNVTIETLASQLPNVREASGYLFNYPVVDRTG